MKGQDVSCGREYVPSMHIALGSNLNTTKTNQETNQPTSKQLPPQEAGEHEEMWPLEAEIRAEEWWEYLKAGS